MGLGAVLSVAGFWTLLSCRKSGNESYLNTTISDGPIILTEFERVFVGVFFRYFAVSFGQSLKILDVLN